jgi:tetratricopeptide (TPR) repeat protein
VAAVRRAWAEDIPRLLVFDNVDTEDGEALVAQWRPTTGGCRVLITSRRGVWDTALGIAALPLGVLPRDESIALLRRFRAALADTDADAIAAELGDLPLALHLAGSFLKKYVQTQAGDPAAFLARLRDPVLLEHPALQGRATGAAWSYHERSVARAFALSYERLRPSDETDVLALALLTRAAHFAPGEPIPRDLLLHTVDTNNELLATDALERLLTFGLLEAEDDSLTLHRLLARFVQGTAADEEAQAAVEETMINAAYDLNMKGIPAPLLPLLPHLRHATDEALKREDEQAATLANNLGYCLNDMLADYAAARPLYERALAIREQVLGPEHPDTAQSLNNLALLHKTQGDDAAARPLYERALAISEQVLGPTHPDTAQSLNNLAALHYAQGDDAAARPLYERALAICEQVLGPTHPGTASSLNNLAVLLDTQGDYDAARPLYERALAIREQVLGPEHPDTASSLNNLAVLLEEGFSDYEGSRKLYERALAIHEQVLGPQHPHTAQSLNNLAELLETQGDYAAARPLYERALAIWEQVLGPEHPHTQSSRQSLAAIEAKLREPPPPEHPA